MVFATVILKIIPEHRDEALAELKRLSKIFREQPGCISYRASIDIDDADKIHLYGEWESEEVHAAQHQSPHFPDLAELVNTKLIVERGAAYIATPHSPD